MIAARKVIKVLAGLASAGALYQIACNMQQPHSYEQEIDDTPRPFSGDLRIPTPRLSVDPAGNFETQTRLDDQQPEYRVLRPIRMA